MAADVSISIGLTADDVNSAADDLRSKIESIFDANAGKELTLEMQQLLNTLIKDYNQLNSMQESLDKLANSEITSKEYDKALDKFITARRELEKLTASADETRKRVAALTEHFTLKPEQTASWQRFNEIINKNLEQYQIYAAEKDKIDKQLARSASVANYYQKAADTTGLQNSIDLAKKWSVKVGELQKQSKDLELAMSQLNAQATESADALQALKEKGGFIKSEHWVAIQKEKDELDALEASAESAKNKMQEMQEQMDKLNEQGKGPISGRATDKYDKDLTKFEEQLNRATVDVRKYNQEVNNLNTADYGDILRKNFGNSIVDIGNNISQNISQLPRMLEGALDDFVKTLPPYVQAIYSVLKFGVKQVISAYKEAFDEVSNIIKNGFTKTVNVAASAIKALVKEIAKLASNAFLSPIRKLGDAISNIGKQANTSAPSIKQIGRAFLQYGLGARSLYRLINKLRKALFEGFGDLAQVSEPFNAAMSSMMNALNNLKSSFAAAFAPIIQAVAPILTHFINLVAEAVTKIGMLIAALSGQSTYTKVLPVQQSYADSVGKTASNADKAAKATKKQNKEAKELQRTLAGFDDVEILKEPTDSSSDSGSGGSGGSGGGGGGSIGGGGVTSETLAIPEFYNKLAEMLKEIWEKADAYDLGVLFGKKLGDLLRAFNEAVPQIEAVTTRIAKIIASFLAGFLSVNETFAELGKAIGNVVNIVFTTLDAFLDTFISYDGFKNLGKDIYLTILNALNTIEWETIYKVFGKVGVGIAQTLNESITKPDLWEAVFRTLTGAISALLARAYGFVHTLKWGDIGTAFADGVIEGIRTFPYVLLATTAAEFINGIFNALGSFADEMEGHWEEIGKNIANTIRLFFAKTDSKENGKSLGKFLQGLFDALKSFAETIKFEEIAQNIIDFIDGFFEKFDWKENADTLLGLLNDLLDYFLKTVNTIGWENIVGQIWDYIKNSPEVKKFLENIWNTITLIAAAKLQLKLMKFYLLGRMIIGGIFKGIINALLSIGTWIETHIFKPIYDAIMSVFDMGSPSKKMEPIGGWILEGILQGIINAILNIGAWINEHIFTPIKDGIFSAFGIKENSAENIKETGTSIIQGIWDGITEKLSSPVEWLQEHVADPVKGGLEKVFGIAGGIAEKVKDVGSAVIGGFQSGADDETPKVTSSAEQLNTDVQTALGSGDWNNIGSTAITKVKSGMDGVKSTITNTAQTIQQGVYTALEHADWSKIGSTAINAMKSGMDSIKTSITTTAKNIQSGVYKTLETADWSKIGSTAITKMKEGMDSIKSAITTVAQTIQKGVYTALETGEWSEIGSNALTKVKEGIDSLKDSVVSTAESVQSGIYDALDSGNWSDIGDDIIKGIWNGLNSGWDWLKTKVWNLATSLFNAACNALDIGSPSKLFAEKVGEMIPAGIGVGIIDNESAATSSIETMSKSLVDSAKNIKLPPIAMGEIIPSNVANNSDNSQNTLSSLLNVLQSLQSDMVTRSELEEMLTDMFRTHMNIDFHIGDEKLARHVNKGNSLLDRRYNPVKS